MGYTRIKLKRGGTKRMEIYLPKKLDRSYFLQILAKIKGIDNFNIDMSCSDNKVTISVSRFGLSKLVFDTDQISNQFMYKLVEEKLATFHKAFRASIVSGLKEAVEQIGGKLKE